jgi:hypothetical protein
MINMPMYSLKQDIEKKTQSRKTPAELYNDLKKKTKNRAH